MRDTINAKGEAVDANENAAAKVEVVKLTDAVLLDVLRESPTATRAALAMRFGVSSATIARRLKTLQSAGAIRRVGSRKTGSWVVEQKEC